GAAQPGTGGEEAARHPGGRLHPPGLRSGADMAVRGAAAGRRSRSRRGRDRALAGANRHARSNPGRAAAREERARRRSLPAARHHQRQGPDARHLRGLPWRLPQAVRCARRLGSGDGGAGARRCREDLPQQQSDRGRAAPGDRRTVMLRKGFLALMTLLAAACAQAPVVEQVAEKVLPPAAETPKGVTLPPFETFTLENGMQVLLMEKHDVPLVSFHASIRGGALADPRGKEGVASLVAELLRKGAGRRNAQQFAEAVENVGGDVSTAAGQEQLLVSAEFLSRDAALAVELLGDMLTDPALSPGEFEKLRERSAQQLAAMKDMNLRALTGVYGHAWLFGD